MYSIVSFVSLGDDWIKKIELSHKLRGDESD